MYKERLTLKELLLKNIMRSEEENFQKVISIALKKSMKIYNARLECYNSTPYLNIIARPRKKIIRYRIILTICDDKKDKENAINGFIRRICNCDEKYYPSTIYHLIILSKYHNSTDNYISTYSLKLPSEEKKNNLFFTELNLNKEKNKVNYYLNSVLSNL